ncbi:hypothetical protein OAK98_05360 [Mariniblastus sp.]|nr:hypothetical protein [bacterium]MDA7906346.1 hypothetical protein [Mariniblastus sp.]MDA7884763.1 hypothetical protein [bacterium]MDA7901436.1 hypothetical protein [bacterium]MDA7925637.1 hypothetical protein [Mariniblastus sp.]
MSGNPFEGLQNLGIVSFWFVALIVVMVFKPERIYRPILFRLSIGCFLVQFLVASIGLVLFAFAAGMGSMSSFSMRNGMSPWFSVMQIFAIVEDLTIACGILALFGSLGRGRPKKAKPPAPPKKHPLDD